MGAHHALDMDEAGMRLTLDIVAEVMHLPSRSP